MSEEHLDDVLSLHALRAALTRTQEQLRRVIEAADNLRLAKSHLNTTIETARQSLGLTFIMDEPEETKKELEPEEEEWKLVSKMKVRCINDPLDKTYIGKLGVLLPAGVTEVGVLWAVDFGEGRVWDNSPEEIIRRDFEPAVIINGKPDKDTTG